MNDGANNMLKLVAGVLITIATIAAAIGIYVMVSGSLKGAQKSITQQNKELADSQYLAYDGTEVTGAQVISAIRKYKNEAGFGISVKVGTSSSFVWYISSGDSAGYITNDTMTALTDYDTKMSNAKNINSTSYINTQGNFSSELIYDSKENIRGIRFIQK